MAAHESRAKRGTLGGPLSRGRLDAGRATAADRTRRRGGILEDPPEGDRSPLGLRAQDEDGETGVAEEAVGDGADQGAADAGAAVGGDDDRVGADARGGLG